MGCWGVGLYSDDVAIDVKEDYVEELKEGKSGIEATDKLLRIYADSLNDEDESTVFWLALADTQWKYGRLEERVKEKALEVIRSGKNLEIWKEDNPKLLPKREKVLKELEEKLLSPQGPEKKVKKYSYYRCPWKIGDVYAYRFTSEYAKEAGVYGKYIYFVKISEGPFLSKTIAPFVYFYRYIGDDLLSVDEVKQIDYLCQMEPKYYESYEEAVLRLPYLIVDSHNNVGQCIKFSLKLWNTSERIVPYKNLTYIGNIPDIKRVGEKEIAPYKERWPQITEESDDERRILFYKWNEMDEHLIKLFNEWNAVMPYEYKKKELSD